MTAPLELLLLEDQEDDALLVERALRRGGLEARVRRVRDRAGFLEALAEQRWDLILSDFNLPGFDGAQALEALRAVDPDLPFILVSGEIGEERAAELMRRGASDFVRKDRLERLAPAIEREVREDALRCRHREAMDRLLRLGQAVEQSGDDIVMTDLEGRITYVNAAFTASTGYQLDEALGRHPLDLLGDPTEADQHEAMHQAVFERGSWQGRFRGRRKDGELLLLDSRIAVIRNDRGEPEGFIGTHRDVTRQVEMERQIEQAQRLEAIGTLAGGIAHDFNNLLMAIRGFAEVGRLRAADPRQAKAMAGILKASDRAGDLVQQILAFSRARPQERKALSVRTAIQEAVRFLRATLPTSIALRPHAECPVCVLADPTELQRILVNLCMNGAQAMRGGNGVVGLELDEVALEADERPGLASGRYARIRVTDNGCGMPPEVAARVFEPFFTTRAGVGGTGMGLAVVHGVVAALQGHISVESAPGHGSTFEVLLPALSVPAERSREGENPLLQGSGRILFVDDEAMLCELAGEMLRNLGYAPCTFTDPMEAFQVFKRDPWAFDLVVTDMTMPSLTGDRLVEHLRALRPDLPVVLCTGFSERIDEERASQIGVARLVSKPFEWGAMSAVLRDCLGHKVGSA